MWCYLNCSFGVKTSFKNKDRLTRNCHTTHTFQHPLNVFIPLRLSGHRSPPQTFLFHSQTFHIFTLTSAMQSFKLLPVTLIGSLNIKLTNPARTSLTRIMHWYKKVIEEKKERKSNKNSFCGQMLWMSIFNSFSFRSELCQIETISWHTETLEIQCLKEAHLSTDVKRGVGPCLNGPRKIALPPFVTSFYFKEIAEPQAWHYLSSPG